MEGLIRWWVRNPVAANLLMFIIVTAGWLGLRDIEKEAFPSVQPDIVQVEVIWPGASPKEMEQQVVQRVEEALKNVSNVYRVSSESRETFGSLSVETYPTVNLNAFLNDVKNAVDSITSFPRDMENPRVRRLEWRQEMIRVALAGDVGEKPLTRLANKLRNEMAGLPYISQVDVFGSRREEGRIRTGAGGYSACVPLLGGLGRCVLPVSRAVGGGGGLASKIKSLLMPSDRLGTASVAVASGELFAPV